MKDTITESTTFPIVEITLDRGEEVLIERGSMVYHNGTVSLEGQMNGSGNGVAKAFKAIGRSLTSGESFFITKAKGMEAASKIAIAPDSLGSIKKIIVDETQHWNLNTGVFLACEEGVSYVMEKQSIGKALFGDTGGLFIMKTSGKGEMLISSSGDIIAKELDGSEKLSVDNIHVLAWSSSLDYSLKVASGTFGFSTGEGLVNEFHGKGTVLIQTRNNQSIANSFAKYITK